MFQDNPKTKPFIRLKIIVQTIKIIEIDINLIWAWQIIIVDPKYILHTKQQAKKRITRIGQINHTTTDILIFYNVKIKRKIKCCYCKRTMMISESVCLEKKNSKFLQ